ncbi:amidohydrolase family protein [Blastococcus brunescens]|uniref:amidohydrolase family protein n=1 Tax=Blastococcus brunescens TaxID=1564165 RepID=UPI003BEEE53B
MAAASRRLGHPRSCLRLLRRIPAVSEQSLRSPLQPVDLYLATLDALGISHGVLVQPSVYGQDNSCLLDGLQKGNRRLVGVVDLDVTQTSVDLLEQLSRQGVCGVRLWLHPAILNPFSGSRPRSFKDWAGTPISGWTRRLTCQAWRPSSLAFQCR